MNINKEYFNIINNGTIEDCTNLINECNKQLKSLHSLKMERRLTTSENNDVKILYNIRRNLYIKRRNYEQELHKNS